MRADGVEAASLLVKNGAIRSKVIVRVGMAEFVCFIVKIDV